MKRKVPETQLTMFDAPVSSSVTRPKVDMVAAAQGFMGERLRYWHSIKHLDKAEYVFKKMIGLAEYILSSHRQKLRNKIKRRF